MDASSVVEGHAVYWAQKRGRREARICVDFVEMLKNELSRRFPVWGLSGLERERAGSMGWGGAEAGRSGVA